MLPVWRWAKLVLDVELEASELEVSCTLTGLLVLLFANNWNPKLVLSLSDSVRFTPRASDSDRNMALAGTTSLETVPPEPLGRSHVSWAEAPPSFSK